MSPVSQLPRLLHIGDVPVESSYHGSALLYRLLQNYPPERLRIIEGNLRNSLPERRLKGVPYRALKVGWARPLYTRFNRWALLAYSVVARWRANAVRRALEEFQPEAILSVSHEFLWLTAARFARQSGLPLHLICHDDWPNLAQAPEVFRPWLRREFGRTYRQAASRLCVSPYMAEEYERRYRAPGTVLYPSRAADAPPFDTPPERLLKDDGSLTVAFAGTINSSGHVRSMQNLAQCLEKIGGRLLIFGPLDETGATAAGLQRSNIELRGMIPSGELMDRLRVEADVLFVPMSFAPGDRESSALSFPSKLTDYTLVGLPLLIHGPNYCSAVRWARDHSGVAEVVTGEDLSELSFALEHLLIPAHRLALAEKAFCIGNEFFSHAAAEQVFFSRLVGTIQK